LNWNETQVLPSAFSVESDDALTDFGVAMGTLEMGESRPVFSLVSSMAGGEESPT